MLNRVPSFTQSKERLKLEKSQSGWNLLMEYAIQLLMPLLLALWAGHWLDEKMGSGPWCTLVGMLVGFALGFGLLYKRMIAKTDPNKDKSPPR